MKHFRILEIKDDIKQYTIQYQKQLFFGISFWKKFNNTIYHKYDDALTEIKKVIKEEDYNTSYFGYHYIDAYKIFKSKDLKTLHTSVKTTQVNPTQTVKPLQPIIKKSNKRVFVPKNKK